MSGSSFWFLAFVLVFQASAPELFLLFDDAFHIPVVKPLVTLYFPLDLFDICKRKGEKQGGGYLCLPCGIQMNHEKVKTWLLYL